MYKLKFLMLGLLLLTGKSFATNVWTGGVNEGEAAHLISVVDSSGDGSTVVITLKDFSHPRCAAMSNRVILKSTNPENAGKLFSIALSAFHSDIKVSAFINESCEADRIIMLK